MQTSRFVKYGRDRRGKLENRKQNGSGIADSISALDRQNRNRRQHDDGKIDHETRVDLPGQSLIEKGIQKLRQKRFPRGPLEIGRFINFPDESRCGDSEQGSRDDDSNQHIDMIEKVQQQTDRNHGEYPGQIE